MWNKIKYFLVLKLCDVSSAGKFPFFVSCLIAFFASSHLLIYWLLTLFKYHEYSPTLMPLLTFFLVANFLLVCFVTYKFEVNEKLLKLAFLSIRNHSVLVYLCRKIIQNRMIAKNEPIHRYFPDLLLNLFEQMTRKMNLIDCRSLIYLTGIDYKNILQLFSETKNDVRKERLKNKSTQEIENKVKELRLGLRDSLEKELEKGEFNIFMKSNITDKIPYIQKLSRVIENCILQPSFSKAVEYVSKSILNQLRYHHVKLNEVNFKKQKLSVTNELFFWRYVSQGRMGYPVYQLVEDSSKAKLESLRKWEGTDSDKYNIFLVKVIDKLQKFIDEIMDCDGNLSKKIGLDQWPSDSDYFILYGISTSVQNVLKTINITERSNKKIILIKTGKHATVPNEENVMGEWLTKNGFTNVILASQSDIKNLENNERICFMLGFELSHKTKHISLQHFGAGEVLKKLVGPCRQNNIKVVIIGQSYKIVESDFWSNDSKLFYSILPPEYTTHILTERKDKQWRYDEKTEDWVNISEAKNLESDQS